MGLEQRINSRKHVSGEYCKSASKRRAYLAVGERLRSWLGDRRSFMGSADGCFHFSSGVGP